MLKCHTKVQMAKKWRKPDFRAEGYKESRIWKGFENEKKGDCMRLTRRRFLEKGKMWKPLKRKKIATVV